MDSSGLSRILRLVLLLSLLVFTGLLVHALLTLSSREVHFVFHWAYAWRQALAGLVDVLLPVQVSAVLLGASLLPDRGGKKAAQGPFHTLATPVLTRFLLLAAVYAVLVLAIGPAVRSRMVELEWRSRTGRDLKNRMEAEAARSEYDRAVQLGERVLLLLGEDEQLLTRLDHLRLARAERHSRSVEPGRPPEPAPARPYELSYLEMVRLGEGYLRQDDAFTAYYYAVMARRLDDVRREARNLASDAEERIATLKPRREDREAGELFERKRQGWQALMHGDPLEAYTIFRELEGRVPGDPEVAFFLGESRQKIREISFFIEDAESAFTVPGFRNLLFVNEHTGDLREIVAAGAMVETPGGTFYRDLEAVGLRPDGRVLYHLKAPYGKEVGKHLALRGISYPDGSLKAGPSFLAGSLPEPEGFLRPLGPDREAMRFLQTGGVDLSAEGLLRLWRMLPLLERHGWSSEPAAMEILERLLAPLAFLIGSFLALASGWSGRRRAPGNPPAATWVLVPLIPMAALLGAWLASAARRVLAGALLLSTGFLAALLIMLVVQLVLLAVSLVLLAGQRAE